MTGGLLVAQLALTVVLLSAAGWLTRSFFALYFTDLVIDTRGLVTARMTLPSVKYPTRADQQRFLDRLDERLATVPIFAGAALSSDTPFSPLGFVLSSFTIHGRDATPGIEPLQVFAVTVGPRYFETLGLPLTRGRTLSSADSLLGQEGAVVNERFAAKFFAGENPVGQRVRFTTPATEKDAPWFTIVGTTQSLPSFLRAQDTDAVAYLPMRAEPRAQRTVSVLARASDRAAGNALVVGALREQISALDADLPLFAVQTLDDAVAMGRHSNRMIGSWFVTIALVALILAMVGLYALTAHGVTQRAQEIGVRMALGAQAGQVVWLFVRRTLLQLVIGLLLGIAGALAAGQLLTTFLRDTNPRDPVTLVLVSVLLVAVAMVASIWPARKAAQVDPVIALRAD